MMRGWGDERTDSTIIIIFFYNQIKTGPSSFSGLNTFSLWDRSRVERVELELELVGWQEGRGVRGVAWRGAVWRGMGWRAWRWGGGKRCELISQTSKYQVLVA